MSIVLFVLLMHAAPPPQASARPPQQTTGPQPVSTNADYVIGPQDKLTITVLGLAEFSQANALVDNAGTVVYLDVGVIKAAGKTARQVQADVRQMLIDKGQATNPTVQVDVAAFRSQMVYVSGAVSHPQGYTITGNETLMNVLAQAGFSPSAGLRIQVIRNKPAHQEFWFDRRALENGTAQSFQLQDGDAIIVPDAEKAIVRGEVKSPGMYEVSPDTTLLQVLVLAGDFNDRAARGSVKVTRKNDNGRPTEIKVDHKDYSTFIVKPGDVINISRRVL
jgi:protein involved in polysaccharide export with SLBB domain